MNRLDSNKIYKLAEDKLKRNWKQTGQGALLGAGYASGPATAAIILGQTLAKGKYVKPATAAGLGLLGAGAIVGGYHASKVVPKQIEEWTKK